MDGERLAARMADIDAMEARVNGAPDKDEAIIEEMIRLLDERDEARAALATARREGAEEMRERCARRLEARAARLVAAAVDIEAEDGSDDHGRWLESIDSAALIRALPIDAPGGAT